ncbi:DUF6924 domain-containing protein [Streptomyces sp. enrichment culture]|uniref:DUF6924 domain-containing protein n=1 Tax=Streptomyces sp. enrichment culture TaxID=1795815 RepID=UPI003F55F205
MKRLPWISRTSPGGRSGFLRGGFTDVSASLSIANLDFAEFANATDGKGTFRGFEEG